MNTTESTRSIASLIAHVVSECKSVDPEESFANSLDESGEVDVCGLTFMPSQIWKEMDPTAFRCGVADHADSMDWLEIGGDYYESSDVENARESFVDDLKSELEDLESQRERCAKDDEVKQEELDAIDQEIDALNGFITECENHTF